MKFSKKDKRNLFLGIVAVVVLVLVTLFVLADNIGATGQETCPDGDGWVKVNDLDGHTYTYEPEDGYVVTDNCYKHSTYVHYGTGDTVETDYHFECNPWWNCKLKRHELSHASFYLERVEEEEELCEDDSALNYNEPLPCEYEEEEPEDEPVVFTGVSDGKAPEPKAPVCPNGDTTQVVANPHVWRNGAVATVNAFITEGNSVNIYWRDNNSTDWQHAMSNVKPNSENFVSVEIGGLDPNLGYTFAIEQVEGCGGGVKSVVIDPPANGELFRLSYFE